MAAPGRPSTAPFALLALAAFAAAGCVAPLHPFKWTVPAVGQPMIESAYAVDRAMSPHRSFTRPAEPVDARPLREQAREMADDLRARFLADDGKLFLYQRPPALGDMCIWQGVYTAMASLQYAWDRSPQSLEYAEKAFDGLAMMLRPGLPVARGVLPAGLARDGQDPFTYSSGGYQWKEDASIDSASGWVFGMVLAERLLPSRRERARAALQRFTDDLIANGFRLKNGDGSPTRFGNMGAGLLSPPPGVLLSLAVLSQCARRADTPRCAELLRGFTRKRQDLWASYASAPIPGRHMSSNHNMAFLSLSAALLSEDSPRRWRMYARGMIRLAETTENRANSFWIYLTYWTLEQRPDLMNRLSGDRRLARWATRRPALLSLAKKPMQEFEFPACKAAYETLNSVRPDLEFVWNTFGHTKTVAQPLPVWQRPAADFIWQRNPYLLDDWQGHRTSPAREFTGLDFLLAYYLGLHLGGINPFE
ncbi:MAG: hypothetical protein HY554_13590 [Elusimicrobia bacterium]|nr:hypothetical protein [Elusimicrobiota bacterium]